MSFGQGGRRAPATSRGTDDEPTRVVEDVMGIVHRTEQLARQLEEAETFEPPAVYEEGAPRALLVV